MPSEATINTWWLVALALAFLAVGANFVALARAIRRQYDLAHTPLTDLAATLVRQKVAVAAFGFSWGVVVATSAVRDVVGWDIPFWLRMVFRGVALLALVGMAVEGRRVKRAMDRDARRTVERVETGRAEGHAAGVASERVEMAEQFETTRADAHAAGRVAERSIINGDIEDAHDEGLAEGRSRGESW